MASRTQTSVKGVSILLATTLLILLAGCASPGPSKEEGPKLGEQQFNQQSVEPETRTLFFQAERAFQNREYDKAIEAYQELRRRFPRANRALRISTYRMGSIYYLKEQYEPASREFQRFLGIWPNSELSFDVRYNLAAAEYQMGNFDRAYKALSQFSQNTIRTEGNRRADVVYQLMGLAAEGSENYAGAVASYAAQAQLPQSNRKKASIYRRVESNLARINSTGELDRLLGEVTESAVRSRITQRMSSLASGIQTSEAPVEMQPIEGGAPLKSGSSAERLHIGVILPLSGKLARYGQKALEGILLAAQSFSPSRDFEFRLFIEDSESNPSKARKAVDELFGKYEVSAIIGPFNWQESVAVAGRAQELGVLNISLTAKEGISAKGAYLFQNALTPKVQLESLVEHSIQSLNFRRFAILAPDNAYGRDMAYQFWDLVEQRGGKVVAFESYPPEKRDFQSYVKKMVGLEDLKFRETEAKAIDTYLKEQKEAGNRNAKGRMPPVVDFDAVFLPDSPATVAQIAASFAYFDVTKVPLLGTVEWNSDVLYKRGGRFVEGSVFPGGLSLSSPNPSQRDFIRIYSSSFGAVPDLLAGQAYEAMQLVKEALRETSSSDRNEIVKELSRLKNFGTPLGNVTFDSSRIARRKLPIFSLQRGGNIVQLR